MNKRIIIIAGIVVLLLGGTAFLFFGQQTKEKESEYGSMPTIWSQEEDYKVEQMPEKTLITNTDAGFSFQVPENWDTNSDTYDDAYTFDLIAPNAEIKRDEYGNQLGLLKGCGISISTVIQEIEVRGIRTEIASAAENLESDTGKNYRDETTEVDGYPALKTTTNPSPEAFQKLGKFIFVKIPISDTTLIDIGIRMMPGSEAECVPAFNKFLASFSIQ